MPARPQVAPTDDWRQIELLARAPGQRTYELIRPVVLFGQSPAERAAETGAAERTLYRQVARFDQLGMASLVPPPKVEKHRTPPAGGAPGDPRRQARAPAAQRARADDDLLGPLRPPPQLPHRQAHPRREPAATPHPPPLPALPRHRRPDPAPPGDRPPARRGLERQVHRGVSGDEPADGPRDAEALGRGGVRRACRTSRGRRTGPRPR